MKFKGLLEMRERQGRHIVTVIWCSEYCSLCCWVVDAITQGVHAWLWVLSLRICL